MTSTELLSQHLPQHITSIGASVSRWSNTNVSQPAAIVTPSTEDEIVTTLRVAAAQGLKVIRADQPCSTSAVDGAHGTFVPINDNSIYLDLHNFNSIDLDPEAGQVRLGGGVMTRDVLRVLSDQRFYTCVPNSNAVGIIGFCLGGGSSPFNGLKGLAIDNILSIRLITAAGEVLTLTPSSSDKEEAALFKVLCGAGFGFGVITSLTLRAWPISSLNLPPTSPSSNPEVWTRRLLFPPSAITHAATLFCALQHPSSPRMTTTFLCMRAPPSAPKPGAPMIMLITSFFGPTSEAETTAASTFSPDFTSPALSATTSFTPFATMNDMADPLNRHGDYKEMYAAWLSSVSAPAIERAFERWVEFGDGTPEAKMTSFFVLAAKSTEGMVKSDPQDEKFFPRELRGRGVFAQITPWWADEKVEEKARGWGEEMLAILGAVQHDGVIKGTGEKGLSAWAANLSKGIDLETVWTREKREEIRRVKEVWDPKGLFWNPVVDGV